MEVSREIRYTATEVSCEKLEIKVFTRSEQFINNRHYIGQKRITMHNIELNVTPVFQVLIRLPKVKFLP